MKIALHALIIAASFAAAGCGLKGPLRLPDKDSSQGASGQEDPKASKKNRPTEATTAPVVDPATPSSPPPGR